MPIDSAYPPFEVSKQDIFNFLFTNKERAYPDDKVLYRDADTDRFYTYASVKAAAEDFGKGLRATWDMQKGDVLALFAPNSIDTPVIMWGTLWAGGVLSPANPAYTADELAFQLKDSGARGIVTTLEFLDTAVAAAGKVGIERDSIILLGDARTKDASFKHFTSVRNISGAIRYRKARTKPEDLAFLVYSSGTTGLPKGVRLTHANITSNLLQLRQAEGDNFDWKRDKLLGFLPFFHIYGLTCLIMQTIDRGLEMVVLPRFDLERFCALVQKHRITFSYVVPPVLLALSKHPLVSNYDLTSIRMVNSGAAPLTRELIESLNKRIRMPVKQGYGLSETSPTTHTQPWDEWDSTIGSVGKLLPNMSAVFLDESGKEVPTGETGELALRGPNIFAGYLNKPDLTKEAFTADGFFKTGDIGHVDAQGNFYITDRVKELIKYKGFQVAPAELEGYLVDHALVADAAVIGVYSAEHASELPRAYVVVGGEGKEDDETARKIVSFIEGKVAGHKRLRGGVRFVKEIPKSPSGKILRRILKEEAKKEGEGVKAKL